MGDGPLHVRVVACDGGKGGAAGVQELKGISMEWNREPVASMGKRVEEDMKQVCVCSQKVVEQRNGGQHG